jgi:hypothetical protein
MKKVLILIGSLFFVLSASASTFTQDDVPIGDKLRFGTEVGLTNGTPATLLAITNNDGILWGFTMRWVAGGSGEGDTQVKVNKVNVDAAGYRIHNGNVAAYTASTTAGNNILKSTPNFVPIRFSTSLDIKMIESNSSNDAQTLLTPIYSLY